MANLSFMLENIIQPIRQRIMMTIGRGTVDTVDDSKGVQYINIELLKDEVLDNLESFKHYGFSSNPPVGSEVVAVFVGGNREHGFVIASEDRSTRLKNLEEGESIFYGKEGQYVKCKSNGDIESKSGNITFTLTSDGKFKAENSTGELVTQLSDTLAALAAEPFIVNKGTFTAIKVIVDSFKA